MSVRGALTANEREVLASILAGKMYKMIAAERGISWKTVASYAHNIRKKLLVDDRTPRFPPHRSQLRYMQFPAPGDKIACPPNRNPQSVRSKSKKQPGSSAVRSSPRRSFKESR